MEVKETRNGTELTIAIAGRLDTVAAPAFIQQLNELLAGEVDSFILDMKDCDYVASSGLRAVLNAQMTMTKKGGHMVVKNVVPSVMEVFEMTGFADILTID